MVRRQQPASAPQSMLLHPLHPHYPRPPPGDWPGVMPRALPYRTGARHQRVPNGFGITCNCMTWQVPFVWMKGHVVMLPLAGTLWPCSPGRLAGGLR